MEITIEENESKGRLVAKKGELELGEMTYSIANDGKLIIVDHTGVNDGHQEKGVGKALFFEMVEMARREERVVMPLCPFARAMFEKNKDVWDVLRHNSL